MNKSNKIILGVVCIVLVLLVGFISGLSMKTKDNDGKDKGATIAGDSSYLNVYKFDYSLNAKECKNCASSSEILGYDSSKLGLVAAYGEGNPVLGLFENNIYYYSFGNECSTRSMGTYEIKDGKIYLYEKVHGNCDACVYTNNLTNRILNYNSNEVYDATNDIKLTRLTKYTKEALCYLEDLIYFDASERCE